MVCVEDGDCNTKDRTGEGWRLDQSLVSMNFTVTSLRVAGVIRLAGGKDANTTCMYF